MDTTPDDFDVEKLKLDYINELKQEILRRNKDIAFHNAQYNKISIPLLYDTIMDFLYNYVANLIRANNIIVEDDVNNNVILLETTIKEKYDYYRSGNQSYEKELIDELRLFGTWLEVLLRQMIEMGFLNFDKEYPTIYEYLEDIIKDPPESMFDNPEDREKITEFQITLKNLEAIMRDIERLQSEINDFEQRLIIYEKPDQLTAEQMKLMSEMNKEQDTSGEKTPNLFVFVCHGLNVMQFKNYYKTRIYAKNVEYMTSFGEMLFPKNLRDLGDILRDSSQENQYVDIDEHLNEYRTTYEENGEIYKTNEKIISNNEYAYLPPMLFTPSSAGAKYETYFNYAIGLYHYALDPATNNYKLVEIVANQKQLVEKMSGKYLTYSSVTSLIRNYIKKIKMGELKLYERYEYVERMIKEKSQAEIFDTSTIIFFTCRYYKNEELLQEEEVLKHFNSSIVLHHEPKKANMFDSFKDNENTISLFSIDLNNYDLQQAFNNWRGALLGVYHQGCGINILNFYNLYPTYQASGTVACLNMGTSMFRIADYIVKFNSQYNPLDGFGVCRMSIDKYLELLETVINFSVKNLYNVTAFLENSYIPDIAFFLRIYVDNFQSDGVSYNEIGHFISICLKNNYIYLIDPQNNIMESLEYNISFLSNNDLLTFLKNTFEKYYPNYKYCDFYIYKNKYSSLSFKSIESDYGGVLRPRPAELSFGGRLNKTKRKRTRNKVRKYKIRPQKLSKKNRGRIYKTK